MMLDFFKMTVNRNITIRS